MKKFLMMFGTAGLLAGFLMTGGCGSSSEETPAVTTTTAPVVTTTTTTTLAGTASVAVSAAGSVTDAGAAIKTAYTFAPGTYTYTIAGFGTGDSLTFPAGVSPTVFNNSFTDGNITVQWALGGNVVSVVLTGQLANELTLNSVADFNTVFGTGTIK